MFFGMDGDFWDRVRGLGFDIWKGCEEAFMLPHGDCSAERHGSDQTASHTLFRAQQKPQTGL